MWEAIKSEARQFARDREMWAWLAAGIATVPLTFAVNAIIGPGLLVSLSFAGMILVWMIALSMRTRQRTADRENHAEVVQMSIEVTARIVLDAAMTERHQSNEVWWYRVWVGDTEIGQISFKPGIARDRRWTAHYPSVIGSSSGFASKRQACDSLAQRAFFWPESTVQ